MKPPKKPKGRNPIGLKAQSKNEMLSEVRFSFQFEFEFV